MEWIGGLLGGLFSQALSAYFWSKTASLALLVLVGLGSASVVLALIWLTSRRPRAGLVLTAMVLGVALTVGVITTRPAHPVKPAKECPQPYKGHAEVSSGWKDRPTGLSSHWTDWSLPKSLRPYQARVRVRIGEKDIYVVFTPGRVHVVGEDVDVRAVEPLAGRVD